eukprot:m.357835 g.357835  ORF g.357835 m.357835 type:complete len:476 (+) comp17957_c0_seq1:256-1683(+)
MATDSTDGQLTMQVKMVTGKQFVLRVSPTATIAEIRPLLTAESEIEPADQRIVYSGKILKDSDTLQSLGFKDGHALHLVKKASPPPVSTSSSSTTTQSPPTATSSASVPPMAGFPGLGQMSPEMMAGMLENPMVQSMMSNPAMMDMALQMNPQLRQLVDNNPELRAAMMDPNTMREAMAALRDPSRMQDMMRQADMAMRNIESMPGGFNHLRRFHETVAEPLDAALRGGRQQSAEPTLPAISPDNPFASLFEPPVGDAASAPNSQPLPNPWQSPPSTSPASQSRSGASTSTPSTASGSGMGGGLGSLPDMFGALDPEMVQAAREGRPSVELIEQMMAMPGMDDMMRSMASNPELMRQMMAMHPGLASNPQLRDQMAPILDNPELLRTAMNPDFMRSMLQMQQGGTGGAFGGAQTSQTGSTPPTPSAPSQPPAERFASQLEQLHAMGFYDDAANLRALTATQGNVQMAIDRLLSGN